MEGSEFEVLRDLIASGALCERVDHLWVEWHGSSRVDARALGLPIDPSGVARTYAWMLTTLGGGQATVPERLSPHCRTLLMKWA